MDINYFLGLNNKNFKIFLKSLSRNENLGYWLIDYFNKNYCGQMFNLGRYRKVISKLGCDSSFLRGVTHSKFMMYFDSKFLKVDDVTEFEIVDEEGFYIFSFKSECGKRKWLYFSEDGVYSLNKKNQASRLRFMNNCIYVDEGVLGTDMYTKIRLVKDCALKYKFAGIKRCGEDEKYQTRIYDPIDKTLTKKRSLNFENYVLGKFFTPNNMFIADMDRETVSSFLRHRIKLSLINYLMLKHLCTKHLYLIIEMYNNGYFNNYEIFSNFFFEANESVIDFIIRSKMIFKCDLLFLLKCIHYEDYIFKVCLTNSINIFSDFELSCLIYHWEKNEYRERLIEIIIKLKLTRLFLEKISI